MNAKILKSSCCVIVTSLLFTGCAGVSPEGNAAIAGVVSGIGAGSLARGLGASGGESAAIGLATGAVIAATVYVIAKHQATERQRRVAEERGRVAAANRESQRRKAAASKSPAKKKSRYIAVDTVKDDKSKGAKSVMIFDTQSQEIVGNDVYDVKSAPPKGSVAKFSTYSAEYVGSGG
jgi:hypothetical protein